MHEVNATFDLVGLVGSLANVRKHGAYYIGACPICGGRDRFNLKHTNAGDLWICRKCSPSGKYQDSIAFVMQYYNVNFLEAVKRMGGELKPDPQRARMRIEPKPQPVQVIPAQEWQLKAWAAVDKASDLLLDDVQGLDGRAYLIGRGIDRAAMYSHLLGYDPAKYDTLTQTKRPAIVIPWMDSGDVITAIKYRFIDDKAADKKYRFTCMGGSIQCVYGLAGTLPTDETLLIVEGEINAISITQTIPAGVSVISTGGDVNGNAAILQALARHYKKIVIWMDEVKNIKAMTEKTGRRDCKLLKSPVIDGVKYDANEMLKRGLLVDFLQAQLSAVCIADLQPAHV